MTSVLLAFLLIVAAGSNAAAHYACIVPESFRVSTGDTVVVGFHSADSFPESSAILTRLQEPTIHTDRGPPRLDGLKEDGKRLTAVVNIAASGHVIVTAVYAAAIEDMKPASFEEYLEEEGLGHIVQARARSGESDKAGKERYTIVREGDSSGGCPDQRVRDGRRAAVRLSR